MTGLRRILEQRDARVAVGLLGGERVVSPTSALDGDSLGPRAQVVLARLALAAGATVGREELAEAVWGEALPASWRGSLRNLVGRIRTALDSSGLAPALALNTSEGGYALIGREEISVDLLELRAAVDAAARALAGQDAQRARALAEAALESAGRPFLPTADGDWVEGLRAEIFDLRLHCELLAGEAALALGDADRARSLATRLLAEAPLREDGHRLLMRALRTAGRRAEALAAYDACRRLTVEELGVTPGPATERLFLEILAEEAEARPRAPDGIPDLRGTGTGLLTRLAEQTPFVGRVATLDRLVARARLALDAGPLVVCLYGEPGLGKTRLAAELARRVREEGMTVLYGRADERLALPYAAALDALEQGLLADRRQGLRTLAGEHLQALSTVLPGLRDGTPGSAAPRDAVAQQLPRSIMAGLRAAGEGHGALVVLDDMQWAARTELEIVSGLLTEPVSARLLVLVLHRGQDDAAALGWLGGHPRLTRVALEPLDQDEVTELAHVLGHDRDGDYAWRISGGNALLATELLGRADDGPVSATGPGRGPIDARYGGRVDQMREILNARLRSLPAGASEVLALAAVAGTAFDVGLIVAASSLDAGQAEAALSAARRAHVLVAPEASPDRLAFRHDLVRQTVLEAISEPERASLHERLGLQLEAALPPGPQADPAARVSLAYHFASAAPLGDWHRVIAYSIPVARAALEARVYEDVVTLTSRALASLAVADDVDSGVRLDLEIMLGTAQRALGDPAGPQTLVRAFELARVQGDAPRMADAALAFSSDGPLSADLQVEEAHQLLFTEALGALAAIADQERARRARLLARIAIISAWRGSEPAGRPALEQALALARELGDDQTLAAVLSAARAALTGASDLARLSRLEADLSELTRRLDDPGLRLNTALWRFESAVQRGEGADLEARLHEAAGEARLMPPGIQHHSLAYHHAALALLRGRTGEADGLVARAADIGRGYRLHETVVEAVRLTQLMLVRGEQRRLGELRVQAALFEVGPPAWLGALAIMDVALGERVGAGERLDAVVDDYEHTGPTLLFTASSLAYQAATVIRLGGRARAERLRAHLGPLSGQGTWIVGFAGPFDYHLGLLERFLGRETEAKARFADAAEFSRRLGAPRWQARCEALAVA